MSPRLTNCLNKAVKVRRQHAEKLNEIKDGAEYTVNEYSVWLEVASMEDDDRKILIHPSAFDSLTKAIAKAKEIGGVDGDKATKDVGHIRVITRM